MKNHNKNKKLKFISYLSRSYLKLSRSYLKSTMEAYSIEETALICKYPFSYSDIKIVGFIAGLVGNVDEVGEDFYRAIFNACNTKSLYCKKDAITYINSMDHAEKLMELHKQGKFNNLSAILGFVGIPHYSDYIMPYRIETNPDGTQIIIKTIKWCNVRDDLLLYLKHIYMKYEYNFNPMSFIGKTCETDEEWWSFINTLITEISERIMPKIAVNYEYMIEKTLIKVLIETYKCLPKYFKEPLKQLTFNIPDTKPCSEIPLTLPKQTYDTKISKI